MASIVFRPGITWGNLPPAQERRVVDADALRGQIETMRREWQESGADMTRVTCNLEMIFSDVLDLLPGGAHD